MEYPISPSKPQHFFNIRGISPTRGERSNPMKIKGRQPFGGKNGRVRGGGKFSMRYRRVG